MSSSNGTSPSCAFQHTAARRRLGTSHLFYYRNSRVSTHSRPKAAGQCRMGNPNQGQVSTHSRPKAAGLSFGWLNLPTKLVSTHSRPKAAGNRFCPLSVRSVFQHTAARRRLADKGFAYNPGRMFQHTAARRRLVQFRGQPRLLLPVSTHSRPKAAGCATTTSAIRRFWFQHTAARRRLGRGLQRLGGGQSFNTQPPEGGWGATMKTFTQIRVSTHSRPKAAGPSTSPRLFMTTCFNTQPPEGGWPRMDMAGEEESMVSTHSRPKAAGRNGQPPCILVWVSTHSRPKAAGDFEFGGYRWSLGFNTQPPEGGWSSGGCGQSKRAPFQHTAARRRLGRQPSDTKDLCEFQHTAARRRLADCRAAAGNGCWFQHTAARRRLAARGCPVPARAVFQHTAARRRLGVRPFLPCRLKRFQHTAARRRLAKPPP